MESYRDRDSCGAYEDEEEEEKEWVVVRDTTGGETEFIIDF
jgi:hypothetical protein